MNPIPLAYQSGHEILKGDRVTYHGEPGEIEFVVEKLTGDPAIDWYMKEFGRGVMVLKPKFFGRVFLQETQDSEDLILIARA